MRRSVVWAGGGGMRDGVSKAWGWEMGRGRENGVDEELGAGEGGDG